MQEMGHLSFARLYFLLGIPPWVYGLGALVCFGLIYAVSDTQGFVFGPAKSLTRWVTNLGHIPLYGVLSFLIAMAMQNGWKKGIFLSLVISLLCAGFDEWHQGWVPGREASLRDFGMDIVGIIIGLVLAKCTPCSKPVGDAK